MADIDDVMDKLNDVLTAVADNKELLEKEKSMQQICWHCGGDGVKVIGEGSGSCPDCGGTGVRPFGRVTNREDE